MLLFGLTVFADISWIFIIDRTGLLTIRALSKSLNCSGFKRQRQEKRIAKDALAERSSKVEAAIQNNNNVSHPPLASL